LAVRAAQRRLHQPVDGYGEVVHTRQDIVLDHGVHRAIHGQRPVSSYHLEIAGDRSKERAEVSAQLTEDTLLFGLPALQFLNLQTESLILISKIVVWRRWSRNHK
jgi:hypothetical protein